MPRKRSPSKKPRATSKRCRSFRKKDCSNENKSRGCQWKKGRSPGCRIIKCKKGYRRSLDNPYECELIDKIVAKVIEKIIDPNLKGEGCHDLLSKKECDQAFNCSWSDLRKKVKCRGKPYTVTGGKSGIMRNYLSNKPRNFI